MTRADLEPKSETIDIDGHVVTRGCVFHADLGRWEPVVTIRPAWGSAVSSNLEAQPDHFQDTPEDAMRVAQEMAQAWMIANDPRAGLRGSGA